MEDFFGALALFFFTCGSIIVLRYVSKTIVSEKSFLPAVCVRSLLKPTFLIRDAVFCCELQASRGRL